MKQNVTAVIVTCNQSLSLKPRSNHCQMKQRSRHGNVGRFYSHPSSTKAYNCVKGKRRDQTNEYFDIDLMSENTMAKRKRVSIQRQNRILQKGKMRDQTNEYYRLWTCDMLGGYGEETEFASLLNRLSLSVSSCI